MYTASCICITWGDGIRMQYGNKASQRGQCDALDNVVLLNLRSWHSCGSYFKSTTVFPNGIFQQDNVHGKIVQERFAKL